MKFLICLLIIPFYSIGQTIHVKSDEIVYEGGGKIKDVPAAEILKRIREALNKPTGQFKLEEQSPTSLKAKGSFILKTPYNSIRTVDYSIKLKTAEGSYYYIINEVKFKEQKRGEKAETRSSKEVLKNMKEPGQLASDTEEMLDETDMRFQQVFAFIKTRALETGDR